MVSTDHRLLTGRAQIDNRQTAVPQTHVAFDPVALAIWTTMGNSVCHSAKKNRRNGLAVKIVYSCNATHKII
jgi:hypothetical protein